MKEITLSAAVWKKDILKTSLTICWVITVFSSFGGSYLLPITLPAIGTLFPFRILLPVTAVLYGFYAIREKEHIWADASSLERWCYILILIMLVYGAVSLFRSLDPSFTFRKLFNLCFDLCFFFLMLRLCRDEKLRRSTMLVCLVAVGMLCVLGIYEVFFGGIFSTRYNEEFLFPFFNATLRPPVVTCDNINDYAAVLVFCAAVLFLWCSERWSQLGHKTYRLICIGFPVLYFLILATSARLVKVGFWIILVAFTGFLLIADRRRLWIVLVALVLMGGIQFAHQYRYIVPPIQKYLAELETYHQQKPEPNTPTSTPEQPSTADPPPATAEPPKLEIGNPTQPLEEQFFVVDKETGEKALRTNRSAGMRAALLLHSLDCFLGSHGLGVGLGNTETLAPMRNVVPKWADQPQNSIHCFIARIIADFGIFVLIPLCIIALLLLKSVWSFWSLGRKNRDKTLVAVAFLYFLVLLSYPLLSTVSSDAQDCIAMWIYLGMIVLYSLEIQSMVRFPLVGTHPIEGEKEVLKT